MQLTQELKFYSIMPDTNTFLCLLVHRRQTGSEGRDAKKRSGKVNNDRIRDTIHLHHNSV